MSYLLLAILISTLIVVLFRLFDNFRIDVHQAITMNYLVAALSGLAASHGTLLSSDISGEAWFPLSLVTGVFFILGFYLFAYSAVTAGVAITAVSGKMSVIIPVAAGFILFGESAGVLKLAGIALVLISFVLILWKEEARVDRRFVLLPVLLLVANGINDTLLKTAEDRFITTDAGFTGFLSVVFLAAFILGVLFTGGRLVAGIGRISWVSLAGGVLLGGLNWGSTYFFLKGLSVFDVSYFIPVFNAGVVSLSALAGVLAFRERVRPVNLLGIILALTAISIMAWK